MSTAATEPGAPLSGQESPTPVPLGGSAPYAAPVPVPAVLTAPHVPGLPLGRSAGLAALAYAYRKRQMSIAAQSQTALDNLWQSQIDPSRFAESWSRVRPVMFGVISRHYGAAAADAASFYQNARVMAGPGYLSVPGVDLDPAYAQRVMNSMSAGTFFHQVKQVDSQEASSIANRALQGAGTRLVLQGSRDTVTKAAIADPDARGWERVIEPGSCGFCSMLAGRGGVYTSATVQFRAHDHCRCLAEPVWEGKGNNQDLSKQWAEVTRGKHGAAARAAWNKHWESQ